MTAAAVADYIETWINIFIATFVIVILLICFAATRDQVIKSYQRGETIGQTTPSGASTAKQPPPSKIGLKEGFARKKAQLRSDANKSKELSQKLCHGLHSVERGP